MKMIPDPGDVFRDADGFTWLALWPQPRENGNRQPALFMWANEKGQIPEGIDEYVPDTKPIAELTQPLTLIVNVDQKTQS